MTDTHPRYPLDHLDLRRPPAGPPALLVSHRKGLAFCQVMARSGHADAVAQALGIVAGSAGASRRDAFTALPLAPGQWMLTANRGRDGRFTAEIAERVHGIGYASEQSHGRAAFRVSGAAATELLTRECRLDLDGGAARDGFVGQTVMADVGVLIHRVDDTPTFDLVVYSGYAEHFWGWLSTAAKPFNATFAEETLE
ncbi:MAG: sarcosine oxidase subunit gamma family protein [Ectothiorhodospiraceae bacterium]